MHGRVLCVVVQIVLQRRSMLTVHIGPDHPVPEKAGNKPVPGNLRKLLFQESDLVFGEDGFLQNVSGGVVRQYRSVPGDHGELQAEAAGDGSGALDGSCGRISEGKALLHQVIDCPDRIFGKSFIAAHQGAVEIRYIKGVLLHTVFLRTD